MHKLVTQHLRKPKKKDDRAGQLHELPRSLGGLFFHYLRPRLPFVWQYGWRFKALQATWLLFFGACAAKLAMVMFGSTDEEIREKAAQYKFVRDEQGRVIDVAYKPVINAAQRARDRATRLRNEEDM
jgi:hypothetical protein